MHDLTAAPPVPPTATAPRTAGRWMLTFVGFPIGGLTASFVAGPVDSAGAALLGGAVTGAILGAVQAWGLGRRRPAGRTMDPGHRARPRGRPRRRCRRRRLPDQLVAPSPSRVPSAARPSGSGKR